MSHCWVVSIYDKTAEKNYVEFVNTISLKHTKETIEALHPNFKFTWHDADTSYIGQPSENGQKANWLEFFIIEVPIIDIQP